MSYATALCFTGVRIMKPSIYVMLFSDDGALEHAVNALWRFVCRPEVRVVITAMAVLLLGMCVADGSWRSMFTPEAGK